MAMLNISIGSWFGSRPEASPRETSEREVYDFCRRVYRETGGVTPELRAAYDRYKKSVDVKREARVSASR